MNKPNILMLGWEFPPLINGGLGVACYNIAKSLSAKANVTMILPRTTPGFVVENVDLIGLNHLDVEKLKKVKINKKYEEFAEVHSLELDADPYHPVEEFEILKKVKVTETEEVIHPEKLNPFDIGELYGSNLLQKIADFSKHAAQIAEELDFDLIHCHDWMTTLAGLEIKSRSGKPLIMHVHSLEYDRSGPDTLNWVYNLEKWGMQQADFVVPVSNYTGSIIEKHYKIPAGKVLPVPNGASEVTPYKEKKSFPEKVVLFLGRVTGQKGPQYFLDIASVVLQHYKNVRFVMAGTGDRLKGIIETGAYKNLGNRFHFTGFQERENVHKLFSIADVYCMPSVSEPFGLSALEAAQFGIPCVISKQSGVSEVLYGALTANYWEVNKMAEHILSLLTNDSLKESVVKKATEDVKKYTWKKTAEKIMNVYEKALL